LAEQRKLQSCRDRFDEANAEAIDDLTATRLHRRKPARTAQAANATPFAAIAVKPRGMRHVRGPVLAAGPHSLVKLWARVRTKPDGVAGRSG
jgi:hypothetical protein